MLQSLVGVLVFVGIVVLVFSVGFLSGVAFALKKAKQLHASLVVRHQPEVHVTLWDGLDEDDEEWTWH